MQKYCFGADIGGTAIKIGLFSENGDLLEKWEIPTRRENNGQYILQDLGEELKQKCLSVKISKEQILGVGLGAPGPVTKGGVINGCVNMGWGVFSLTETFRNIIGIENIKAGNDARVAALGEYWNSAEGTRGSMVMVTLGTGVGGGIIIDGEIIGGTNGAAGEIGHIVVEKTETDYCGCGKQGCLEQFASATGIVRLAKRFLLTYEKPSTLKNIKDFTAKDVVDEAKAGDAFASDIMERVFDYLGQALADVSCVVDTDKILIGGGVSKAGDYLLNGIIKYYEIYAFHASRKKEFALAKLGNDAGIYGCARLILDK